ncbi:MAG: D-aminoacyl-tRNA deacylase [Terriglobales bacterium]
MRAVVQRVSRARVTVGENDSHEITGEIGLGLLVLLGVGTGDTRAEADYLLEKIVGLRIFEDAAGKMNLSVAEVGGALLVVSQFTLYGGTSGGARALRVFRGTSPHFGPALRDREVSRDDASGTGQRRASHHPARFRQAVLRQN